MNDITRKSLQIRLDLELEELEDIEREITSLNDELDGLYDRQKKSNEIISALKEDLNK